MKRLAFVLAFLIVSTANSHAWHTEYHKTLEDATLVLQDMRSSADEQIPTQLISKAKAIIIIPSMLKGGFIFGMRYGEGVATVRDSVTGEWGAPSFITTAGGSFGFQAGAQAVDLVLLVMNERGLKGLLKDKFTLGGDIALTAGPIGRYAEAGTDILFQGEIYSYSRSKGLFGGVSLKGTVLQPNESSNEAYYGKSYNAKQILMENKIKQLPKTAQSFIKNINRLAPPPYNPYLSQPVAADAEAEFRPAKTKPATTTETIKVKKSKQPLW